MAQKRPTGHLQVKIDKNGRTRSFWAFWRDSNDRKGGRRLGPAHVRDSGRRTARGAVIWRAGHGPKPVPEYLTPKEAETCLEPSARRCRSATPTSATASRGGREAHQLSSVLEKCTTIDPVRFARLALTLPDSTHPYYFDAILRGVGASEHSVPLDLTCDLCVRCHALPDRPSGIWIGSPIIKHADEEVPGELVALVVWYATEARDPESDRDLAADSSGDQLLQQGLNCVRGSVAGTITHLVYAREDNFVRLRPAVKGLVSDHVMAVRTMAARILLALLRYHGDDALTLFETLVDGADDRVLASHHAQDFLRYRAAVDFARLRRIMERMVRSDLPRRPFGGRSLDNTGRSNSALLGLFVLFGGWER